MDNYSMMGPVVMKGGKSKMVKVYQRCPEKCLKQKSRGYCSCSSDQPSCSRQKKGKGIEDVVLSIGEAVESMQDAMLCMQMRIERTNVAVRGMAQGLESQGKIVTGLQQRLQEMNVSRRTGKEPEALSGPLATYFSQTQSSGKRQSLSCLRTPCCTIGSAPSQSVTQVPNHLTSSTVVRRSLSNPEEIPRIKRRPHQASSYQAVTTPDQMIHRSFATSPDQFYHRYQRSSQGRTCNDQLLQNNRRSSPESIVSDQFTRSTRLSGPAAATTAISQNNLYPGSVTTSSFEEPQNYRPQNSVQPTPGPLPTNNVRLDPPEYGHLMPNASGTPVSRRPGSESSQLPDDHGLTINLHPFPSTSPPFTDPVASVNQRLGPPTSQVTQVPVTSINQRPRPPSFQVPKVPVTSKIKRPCTPTCRATNGPVTFIGQQPFRPCSLIPSASVNRISQRPFRPTSLLTSGPARTICQQEYRPPNLIYSTFVNPYSQFVPSKSTSIVPSYNQNWNTFSIPASNAGRRSYPSYPSRASTIRAEFGPLRSSASSSLTSISEEIPPVANHSSINAVREVRSQTCICLAESSPTPLGRPTSNYNIPRPQSSQAQRPFSPIPCTCTPDVNISSVPRASSSIPCTCTPDVNVPTIPRPSTPIECSCTIVEVKDPTPPDTTCTCSEKSSSSNESIKENTISPPAKRSRVDIAVLHEPNSVCPQVVTRKICCNRNVYDTIRCPSPIVCPPPIIPNPPFCVPCYNLPPIHPPTCCKEHLSELCPKLGRELNATVQDGTIHGVQQLLDAGANVNYKSGTKWTPLHRAAAKANADVLTLLLRRGACVNAKTSFGYTALHIASYNDLSGLCVEKLIDGGADVNLWNRVGKTALHLAAESGNAAAIRALLNVGASKISKDTQGLSPADLAKTACIRRLLRP